MRHKWKWGQIPTDYGTGIEYVRYCENCGLEDSGEDDLPPCDAEGETQFSS